MTKKSIKKAGEEAKKSMGKATKWTKAEQKKNAENMAELYLMFAKMGSECGVEIAKVARELHPDALFIFPLYRGCVVIPKQDYTGSLQVVLYHDPHWMGADEVTTENLPRFRNELEIHGQRSGQDFQLNGGKLEYEETTIWKYWNDIESDAGWSYVKEHNPNAIGMCIAKDVPKNELKKRVMDRIWEQARKHIHMFRTKEDEKKCKCGVAKISCICKKLEELDKNIDKAKKGE